MEKVMSSGASIYKEWVKIKKKAFYQKEKEEKPSEKETTLGK